MPFTVIVLGACLLMTRIARDPRGGRLDRPAADRARRPVRSRGADPQRDCLAGAHLGGDRLVRHRRAAGGAAAPDRRRRGRCPARLRPVGVPQPGRPRQPRCRAARRRTRCTCRASTSSPGTIGRRSPATWPSGRRRSSSCAGSGSRTTCSTCSSSSASRCRWSASSGCRGVLRLVRPAAAPADQRDHVPVHEPRLPGRDPVGHVPARRRPGPRPVGHQRPLRAGYPDRLDRAARGRGRIPWRGSGPTLGIFGSTLFSVVLLSSFAADSAGTARVFNELAVRMAAAGHPLDASAGPVITNFPIWLAETQRIPTLALPNEPPS